MVAIEELLRPGGQCRLKGGMQELFLPDAVNANRWVETISNYEYRDILSLCTQLRKYLTSKRMYVTVRGAAHSLPDALSKIISKRSAVSETDGRALLTVFLGDPRNVMVFFRSLSGEQQRLMEESVKTIFLSEKTVKRIMGRSGITGRGRTLETVAELKLFACTELPELKYKSNMARRYVFELNPILRHSLLPLAYNSLSGGGQTDVLPEGEMLKTFSGESDIFPLMKLVENAWRTGTLTINASGGSVSKPKLKAFLAKTRLAEFFASSPVISDLTMRAMMTVRTFLLQMDYEWHEQGKPIDGLQRLQDLFDEGMVDEESMFDILLGHLEKSCRGYIGFEPGHQMTCIDGALLTCKPGFWMSIEQVMLVSRTVSPADDLCMLFRRIVWAAVITANQRTGATVDAANLYAQVAVPFAQAYLFMMAAFGFAEVAYRDPQEGDVCCFSGLRYVRLTHLGAYVLGMEKTYSPPEPAVGKLFEADTDNLIVRSLEKGNVYEPLVEAMAERISSSRFRLTHGSFLAGCRTVKDIKEAVTTFRQVVCPKPPEVWERFFAQVEVDASAISRHKDGDFMMWSVSPDDAELLRIVSSDPLIRKYTVKVEGYMLLVEKRRADTVKERLKDYGYMMD